MKKTHKRTLKLSGETIRRLALADVRGGVIYATETSMTSDCCPTGPGNPSQWCNTVNETPCWPIP
jgi:hypothetical protein